MFFCFFFFFFFFGGFTTPEMLAECEMCCLIRRLQQVFTDATLTQGGMYLPPVEGEGGEAEEYGNSLPAFLFGIAVLGMQTGVTELGSLLFYWAGLCHFPKSLRKLQTHYMAVVLDNLEDVLGLRSGKFKGEQALEKAGLAREFHRLNDEHGIEVFVYHAPTRAQLADDASRDKDNREMRTLDAVFEELQRSSQNFQIDWMSSYGCRHDDLDGRPVPYVSWGFDPESSGMSVMEHDLSALPGGGGRVHGFLFPPPQMLRVLVRHVLECRANLVLVAPNPPEPYPAWRASISQHVWKVKPLADEFCADRMHEGWKSVRLPGHAAFFMSFE